MKKILIIFASVLSLTSFAEIQIVMTTDDMCLSGKMIPFNDTFGAVAIGDCGGAFRVDSFDGDSIMVVLDFLNVQQCQSLTTTVVMSKANYMSFKEGALVPATYRFFPFMIEKPATVQIVETPTKSAP